MADFSETIKDQHQQYLNTFQSYRDQLTDVLFYGERISRSELTRGKDEVIQSLKSHVETIRQVLLPAITKSEDPQAVNGIDLFVEVQDNLLNVTNQTEENVEFFANPDAPKEDRNDAARETLKDLYRLDSMINLYLNLIETHLLKHADRELDEDEKAELLAPLRNVELDT